MSKDFESEAYVNLYVIVTFFVYFREDILSVEAQEH